MISKLFTKAKACHGITNGATVLVGGFGQPGTPNLLLHQLQKSGVTDLILVKNDASEPGLGVSLLIEAGQVTKLITSHIGLNPLAVKLMHTGELKIEVYPQGILAEKIRAAGAGLGGILSDIGLHLEDDKKQQVVINDKRYRVEPALRGDVALIHADIADEMGNLIFTQTAYNFNPAMATAADLVIVEANKIVSSGTLDPDRIHVPGAFVDRLVEVSGFENEYGVLAHHAL